MLQIPVSTLQELLSFLLRIPLIFVQPFRSPPSGIESRDSLLATILTVLLQLEIEYRQFD